MKFYRNLILPIITLLFFQACMTHMSESSIDLSAGFNGSFEHFTGELPSNWWVYTQKTAGEGDFTIRRDTSEFTEGKQSLRFTVISCTSQGGRFSPGISQEILFKPGEEYRIGFCVKITKRISG